MLLDEVTPHTFRHTWLKRMMDDPEIPLNVILDLAGHASTDSLRPYTVPSEHDRQKAVERLAWGYMVRYWLVLFVEGTFSPNVPRKDMPDRDQ